MVQHIISTEVSKSRVSKWLATAQPIQETWIERRQAISFGGHTYLVANGQVFQCAHCGHYDPEWRVTEVLSWFEDVMGIKPHEIEIVCSVAKVEDGE